MASFFKKHKAEKTGKGADKAAAGKPDEKAQTSSPAANAISPTASDGSKPTPLLDDDDEQFLERLVSKDDDDDDGPPPALPPRPKTPDLTWDSDSDSVRLPETGTASAPTTTATATKKQNRFSRLFHRKPSSSTTLTVPSASTNVRPEEADREWADLNGVLSRLGIESTAPDTSDPSPDSSKAASTSNRAKSAALTASAELQSLLRQFVLVLKDIMHGGPTAVDDLVALLDGRNDVLKRGFDKLPSSMQKLVTQLPKKLTSSLGPEVLAAAAEAQGLKKETDAGGLARFLMPKNLSDFVLTPAIVKSMLKAIVNALKVRWPAFVGTNVLWSTAVFLLLFVLWYCHKRGKEEREKREKEAAEGGELQEGGQGEEMREVGEEGVSSAVVVVEPPLESPRS